MDKAIPTFRGLAQLYQDLKEETANPEDTLLKLLRTFRCSRNQDIETFLHKTALEFELRERSRTYLWLYPEADQLTVAGYFTLALDVVELPDNTSKSLKKKLSKGYILAKPFLPAYLIGQLGRNDLTPKEVLPGRLILSKALSIVEKANSLVGNKLVIIDVVDGDTERASRLVAWYKNFGFRKLDFIETKDKKLLRLYLILRKK